jgi:hypothetical protein
MNQYYLMMILAFGAVLGFFILWFIFGRFTKDHYEDLEKAQKASVEHHYLSTSLNAVGLGLGIFLVFFMASWGELFITLGMIFVLLSIVAYVGFEWVAKYDDQEIARLQEILRLEELDRQKALVRSVPGDPQRQVTPGGDFKLVVPNTLRIGNGYIDLSYEPREKRDIPKSQINEAQTEKASQSAAKS